MNSILLLGGGGHCRSVLDSLFALGIYDQVGIVDKPGADNGKNDPAVPVVGTDDDLPELYRQGWTRAFITLGGVKPSPIRARLHRLLKDIGFELPAIIDPSAIVSEDSSIAEGVYVGKGAIINTGSLIEQCAIINTGSIIEHDCKIGAFAHVSPGVTLCGQVSIGQNAHIGAGSVVRQGITVGDRCLVGAGSVLVKDLADETVAYGNPCRVVK